MEILMSYVHLETSHAKMFIFKLSVERKLFYWYITRPPFPLNISNLTPLPLCQEGFLCLYCAKIFETNWSTPQTINLKKYISKWKKKKSGLSVNSLFCLPSFPFSVFYYGLHFNCYRVPNLSESKKWRDFKDFLRT